MASVQKFRNLRSTRYVKEGEVVTCLYPKHGRRNIMTQHTGKVVAVGSGPGGRYITVQGEGGIVRSLSESKIVKLRKHA